MDVWVVPLSVAAIGALATIVAAYLALAKDRRDVRANIERDIEIVSNLPEESEARRMLQGYIHERVQLMAAEKTIAAFNRQELSHSTVGIIIPAAFITGELVGRPWQTVGAVCGAYLFVIVATWGTSRRRNRAVTERLTGLRAATQAPEPSV